MLKRFLDELSAELMRRLDENEGRVKRIVANLEVSAGEYKRLLVNEVVDNVCIEAEFAPEKAKAMAIKLLEKFLIRDERLFC